MSKKDSRKIVGLIAKITAAAKRKTQPKGIENALSQPKKRFFEKGSRSYFSGSENDLRMIAE
jgi:hypothetical protein